MPLRLFLTLCLTVCALSSLGFAQDAGKSTGVQDIDLSSLLKETQQSTREPGYAGVVWWIPTDYWEIALEQNGMSEEKAKQRYAPLRKYTVVAVALGKIGIGNINWVSEPEIRDNLLLRDAEGNTYPSILKLSGDAEGLAAVFKPIFANILGTMGQNIQLLFFPAVNKMAKPIADPRATGRFSLVLSKLIDGKETIFEWNLPLSTLSPPKYCPIGKERVQANWKYCPWHGVRLDEPASLSAPMN